MAPRPGKPSTAKGVRRLRSSQFAYPKSRKYPINTAKRFNNALARAGSSKTAGSRATIVKRGLRSSNASVRNAAKRAAKRR
jgi:hypothetical protein